MEINIEKLEAHRIVLNENARQFAKRLGLSHAWYYKIKNGERINARLDTIEKIAEALKLPAKDLIK